MGRPLNKRLFAKADAGPTVAGNEIQVHFFNDGDELEATFAEGFIVKQRGTRKFVVSATGTDDTTYDCVLVAGVEPQELTAGQMLIFVKADDDEVYTVSKITGHKATLVKNAVGNNIYDGKSVPWTFSADLTDGYVQIEEAGDNDVLDGSETDVTESSGNVPDKITNLTVNAYGSGGQDSLLINYTPPNDNGFAITEYIVFANGVEFATHGTGRPIFQSGLTAGTTYAIQVQAVNSEGVGELSDAVSGTTNEVEPPEKITGVTLTVLSTTSIRINFTVPFDNGSAITYYTALVDGINHAAIAGVNLIEAITPPPVTLTGLTASTTYAIQLLANNDIGASIPSDAVSATTDVGAEG